MERRSFLNRLCAIPLFAGISACCSSPNASKKTEILHTVLFDLRDPAGSAGASRFLEDGRRILSTLPGVLDFNVYRQCSPKNDFQYGFGMRFASQTDFDAYTNHPDHCRFVEERWNKEVTRFQEADFISFESNL